MRNLRHRYTYKVRREFQEVISDMRSYIIPILLRKQDSSCAVCRTQNVPFDIDHKVYNPMVSMEELQLLCEPCHVKKTYHPVT